MFQTPKEESVSPAAEGSSKMRTQVGNKTDRLWGACVLRPANTHREKVDPGPHYSRHINGKDT